MKKLILFNAFLVTFQLAQGQTPGVLIDHVGSTRDNSAVLDIRSSDQGVLVPRVDIANLATAAPVTLPAEGLLVYNTNGTTGPGYYYWTGSAWTRLQNGAGSPLTGTGVVNKVAFWTSANDLGNHTNFHWENHGNGRLGLGTSSPTSDYLLTLNAHGTNSQRGGIDLIMTSPGINATGINITSASQQARGIMVANSSTGTSNVFWGVGSEFSGTNIVAGYLGYRTGSGMSYGVLAINGTTGAYATNANTYAAFLKGRTVISSETVPTSPLGVDLEVRNTTTGAAAPATISLRQSTSLPTTGNVMANLNFGDNRITGPQARIQALRDAASGGDTDLPTALGFWTTPDGTATLAERMRIGSNGSVRLHAYTTNGIVRATGGTGTLTSGGAIDLTSEVTGTLPVGNLPSLAGDVTGAVNANTVGKIQGRDVSAVLPTNGQVLKWVDASSSWVPSADANTTYSVMTVVDGVAGTATNARSMSALNTKQIIETLAPNVTLTGENYLSLTGQQITASPVNLATSNVTGILPIANGGTGSGSQNWVDLTTAQSVSGVKTWVDQANFTNVLRGSDGLVATPTYAFTSQTNTGMYLAGAGDLRFATAGGWRFRVLSGQVQVNGVARTSNGTAGAPAFSFTSTGNTNTGMYLPAATSLGFSTAGAERLRIDAAGTVQLNAYTTNGILRTSSGNGTITTGGAVTVPEGGTGATTLTGVVIGNGAAAMTAVTGTASQYLRRNAANTAYEFAALTPAAVGLSNLTFNNAGTGAASGTAYNGGTAYTISYNTIGAAGGSGTANYLSRWITSNTLGIGATMDNGTNVGIGTTPHATYRAQVAGDVLLTSGWLRTTGSTGWFNETHGGGWYMVDATWIRSYNNKSIYHNSGIMRTDGTFQVGDAGGTFNVVNGGNLSYRTNVLFANTAGNVGVGNAAPTAKLAVTGPATGSGMTIFAGGGGDMVLNSGGSLFFDGNYAYGTGNYIRPMAANTQAFFTAGAERMRIAANGNVGIGTAAPTNKLNVQGGADPWPLRVQNSSGYIDFGPANASFAHIYTDRPTFYLNKGLYAGAGNALLNASTGNSFVNVGNFGLGTTAPAAKLHVASLYPLLAGEDGMLKVKSVAITGGGGCCGTEAIALQTSIDNRADDYSIAGYGGDIRHVLALQPQGGLVGVGTTGPTEKLDVNGGARVRTLPTTSSGSVSVVVADANGVLQKNANIGISSINNCNVPGTYSLPVYVWYGTYGNENTWQLRTGATWNSGVIISGGTGSNNTVQYNGNVTLNNGQTYYFEARDSWGDGWNGGGYFNLGSPIVSGNVNPTGSGIIYTFSYSPCTSTQQIQRIIRGSISAAGNIVGGGGFSCNSIGSGRYEITFTTPFSDRPSATATQVFTSFDSNGWGGSTLDNAIITHLDQNKIRIVTGNGSGSGSDRDFSFIVIGSQ